MSEPKAMHTQYAEIPVYKTRDGSLIRELMHPQQHAVQHQSLAEASVPPGVSTLLHKHLQTEELYYITQGQGMMTLADDRFAVTTGDSIVIKPGTAHCIANTGVETLKILCCCSPAYSHEDTVLL